MIADILEWIGGTNPDAWAAGAGWFTATIAAVAGIAAFKQVREARALREEQAQPYVVAYMEPNQTSFQIIDLVVKNFGTTAAFDVHMKSDPPLIRSSHQQDEPEPVRAFDSIPILVPNQEWRIFWDSSFSREGKKLQDKFTVTITYTDSYGKKRRKRKNFETVSLLDWTVYEGAMEVDALGIHDIAKSLKAIDDKLKRWGEPTGGLRVYSRDGKELDKLLEDRRKKLLVLRERMRGGSSSNLGSGTSRKRRTGKLMKFLNDVLNRHDRKRKQ